MQIENPMPGVRFLMPGMGIFIATKEILERNKLILYLEYPTLIGNRLSIWARFGDLVTG